MKRLILFPLVGFVPSLGGATAYTVYSAPAVTAVADSLAVRPDTGRHDSASADTLPGNHAAAAPGTTPDSGAASHAVPPAEGATPHTFPWPRRARAPAPRGDPPRRRKRFELDPGSRDFLEPEGVGVKRYGPVEVRDAQGHQLDFGEHAP